MRYLLLFFLLITHPVKAHFFEEWKQFIQQMQINPVRIGSEDHLDHEYKCLEKFGESQLHRRRPRIEGVDRNGRWIPYRNNKITLSNGKEVSASFIQLSSLKQPGYHNFIASQAPFRKNIPIFWQMIWERHINQIVMLTELAENNRELCPAYWPERVGEVLYFANGLQVKLIKKRTLLPERKERIEIRMLEIVFQGQTREVTHYWYRNWADHSAPEQPITIVTLIETIKEHKRPRQAPLLVHCHGGVGRTGVFVTLYHMVQRYELADRPISLFECVGYLRWHRAKLVGNPAQYRFCHRVLKILFP